MPNSLPATGRDVCTVGAGPGSVSEPTVAFCREHGIAVILHPMMHVELVDIGHRCIRGLRRLTRRLPQPA